MPAALLPIIQLVLQYGIPAAVQIIQTFSKATVTQADLDALKAIVATPYGLTADASAIAAYAATLPDASPTVTASAITAGNTSADHGQIKSVKTLPDGTAIVCYTDGSCYVIPAALVTTIKA